MHSTSVSVDFNTIIDGQPLITLPLRMLPEYLPSNENGLVFPDNFCGLRILKPSEVIWLTPEGNVDTNFPYVNVESFNDGDFLGGIEFTGPIGACKGANEPFRFWSPITLNSEGGPPPPRTLIIELPTGSIEFLNFNVQPEPFESPAESLDAFELYSADLSESLSNIAKFFEKWEIDNGYCGIDAYVQELCKPPDHPEPVSVGRCPVSADFQSPC